jgi:transcriptional regulator with XRE-family HTH domain
MGDSISESPENQSKPWFSRRLRELRVAAGKTQREVADHIGVKESTYANAESSRHRRLRENRVRRIAKAYDLGPTETAELVAGWEAMPESEFNKRNSKPWKVRDARKSKLKGYDAMRAALLEVCTLLLVDSIEPDALCSCPEVDMFADATPDPDDACELCNALRLLGLTGYTSRDAAIASLAALQDKDAKVTG